MKNAYLYWTWWTFVSLFWMCMLAFSIWQHLLFLPLVPLGQHGGKAIYGRLRRAQRLSLLVPGFVALAVVLAGLYYIGNLALFPRAPSAAERLPDAVVAGLLASVVGLLTAWTVSSPKSKLN